MWFYVCLGMYLTFSVGFWHLLDFQPASLFNCPGNIFTTKQRGTQTQFIYRANSFRVLYFAYESLP